MTPLSTRTASDARLAVVSFPVLDEVDCRWIEDIRTNRDPRAGAIGAHFLLVFPVPVALETLSEEVGIVARRHLPIPFVIRGARAGHAMSGDGGYVFFAPDDGGDGIARLRDDLYAGALGPHRRRDMPGIPQMTVAIDPDFLACAGLARRLSREGRSVKGILESMEVVDIDGAPVTSARRFVLGEA